MTETIKIVIADDHPIFRRGLRQIIEDEKQFVVVGEAGDGAAALELIINAKPDVAVLDIEMPKMSGLEIAAAVKQQNLPTAIVFLTMYNDEPMFNAAVDAGAKGYVLKDNAIAEITSCINTVTKGLPYITPMLSLFLLNRGGRNNSFAAQNQNSQNLTKTERRVLRLIAEEKTSREIGEILFIHPRTVDNHRTNICQKLNLHGSHALLRFALKHKSELSPD